MKKLFKAISDKFMLMEGKNKDEYPLPFNKNMFDKGKRNESNHQDSDEDETEKDPGVNVQQARKWTQDGYFFSNFMPYTGKTHLSKQELSIFCKSFHKDIICSDLFGYMNEKDGRRDDDSEANMQILDPYFLVWYKAEQGISQFVDDKMTSKIFDRFHKRIK